MAKSGVAILEVILALGCAHVYIAHIYIAISLSDGKIEIYSKHDHTQYKLLALVDDSKYSSDFPLKYIGLTSSNSTPIQLFYDCSSTPAHIDTQLATKYALVGHPLLLQDPVFSAPVDKRNCKCN